MSSILAELNEPQRQAVQITDRPMLVLAGAGSGKTRVITYKIAWLLNKEKVSPKHIFAVTFTNKAAREMQQRLSSLLGAEAIKGLTVSTFHSLGMAIVREEAEACQRTRGFSIFDPSDSLHVIKQLIKADVDDQSFYDSVRQQISNWKNRLVSPEQALQTAESEAAGQAARTYAEYERYLAACNALDLDDLLYLPNQLFANFAPIKLKWQQRVRYLLVDEYQDTNASQYQLVKYLIGEQGIGLTAVGDDDQSIYAWRGAQPENLSQLRVDFADLQLVKLEQNYRSMGRILALANHVIKNNPRPFEKQLWSELGFGDPITIITAEDDEREAEKVVSAIMGHKFKANTQYDDYAILYRGNHQSRILEKKLREMQIPYVITGSQSFFDRSEIKDVLAYLRILVNTADDNAFIRAITVPRRGVGTATLEKLSQLARELDCSLLEAIGSNEIHARIKPSQLKPLYQFFQWRNEVFDSIAVQSPLKVLSRVLDDIRFYDWLVEQSVSPEQAEARWNNVEELLSWVDNIASKDTERDLIDVVGIISLMGIIDSQQDEAQSKGVSLMTLHAAKGLEFPYVTIVGMEEELLPHRTSIEEDTIEEERRLFYVGITRAQRSLSLSYANQRKRFGEQIECQPSRFLDELDPEHVIWQEKKEQDPVEKEAVGMAHLSAMKALLE